MRKIIFCIVIALGLNACNVFAGSGRLVVVADDWPLSSDSESGVQFAVSSMNWLTQQTTNKSILLDKTYCDYPYYYLDDMLYELQYAGYTLTISNPPDWTSETLSQYGAVLSAYMDNGVASKLLEYAQSGGNVLYVGGLSLNQTDSPILLNPYGISYQKPHEGNPSDSRTLTHFSNHPCVEGVFSLWTDNPSYLGTLGNFNGSVVCAENGNDYIIAVPEPATFLLLGLGAVMLRKKHS